jgi:hypothetical protein
MPSVARPIANRYRKVALGGIPRIDWSNPLTRGLCFCWRTLGGLQIDLVNGVYGSTTGSAISNGPLGPQTTMNGTDAPRFSQGRAVLTTSSPGDGKGDFTLAVLANPASNANNSRLLVQSNNNLNYNTPEVALSANSSTAGQFALSTYDGVNSPDSVDSIASVVDGNFHLFSGTRVGNTFFVQLDGTDVTFSSPSTSVYDVRNNYIGVGTYGVTGESPTSASNATFVGADIWNRALGTDLAQYARNINQFLIWPQDLLWYLIGRGGLAGVSLWPYRA